MIQRFYYWKAIFLVREHIEHMKLAIELAEAGRGMVSPNPLVGAVVVKDGVIVGKGAHEYFGGNHAEVNAINDAGPASEGATLICTLEPCDHHGKTPPCVDAIIEAGIKHVVFGCIDPNPLVNNKGKEKLIDAGISVRSGLFEFEIRRQNMGYFSLMERNRPAFTAKTAQTLNGMITIPGRQWVTSVEARNLVHEMRANVDAIMVGIGTILSDDPRLTVRDIERRFNEPVRIIIDSDLRIPLQAKVLEGTAPTIIYCGKRASKVKVRELRETGAEIVKVKEVDKGLYLDEIIADMARRKFLDVMVEGGARILASTLEASLIDRWTYFIAPKMTDDRIAIPILPLSDVGRVYEFAILEIRQVGPDLMITVDAQRSV